MFAHCLFLCLRNLHILIIFILNPCWIIPVSLSCVNLLLILALSFQTVVFSSFWHVLKWLLNTWYNRIERNRLFPWGFMFIWPEVGLGLRAAVAIGSRVFRFLRYLVFMSPLYFGSPYILLRFHLSCSSFRCDLVTLQPCCVTVRCARETFHNLIIKSQTVNGLWSSQLALHCHSLFFSLCDTGRVGVMVVDRNGEMPFSS